MGLHCDSVKDSLMCFIVYFAPFFQREMPLQNADAFKNHSPENGLAEGFKRHHQSRNHLQNCKEKKILYRKH